MKHNPNPALNLAPSGRWTPLKRRRLALRWAHKLEMHKMHNGNKGKWAAFVSAIGSDRESASFNVLAVGLSHRFSGEKHPIRHRREPEASRFYQFST